MTTIKDPDFSINTDAIGQVFKDNKRKHDAVKEIFTNEIPASWDDLVGASTEVWGKIQGRGENLGEIYSSGGDFSARFSGVQGAAEEAATKFLIDEWNRLWKKRKVKIRTALNMTAGAFSWSFEEMLPVVAKRMNILTKNFVERLGDAVLYDPALKEAIIQLEEIQMILEVVDGVFTIYNTVKGMASTLEPLYPVLEIIVSAASIWATGGASAPKFSAEAGMAAMRELQKLIPLILYPLKEQILDAEIEVPNILFDTMDMVQPSEPPGGSWANWVENLGESSYVEITRDLKYNNMSDLFRVIDEHQLTQYLKVLPGTTSSGRSQSRRREISAVSRGEDGGGNNFESSRSSPQFSHASDFLTFDNEGIIQISKKIIEAKDTTEEYYSGRQMHKLIVDALKEDGVIVNYRGKYYDAQATYDSPSGERGAFKKVNDKITDYHNILKALSGEIRADVTESIPVIDFYNLENTGLSNIYLNNGDLIKVDSIRAISTESIANREAIDSNILLDEGNPSFINYALGFHQPMAHFYNTTRDFTFESNVQVDYAPEEIEGKSLLKASGLLNGLFTKVYEKEDNGEDIKYWELEEGEVEYQGETYTYSEIAEKMGVQIPIGVKYSSSHLANRGDTVIKRPLEISEPPPPGWEYPWGYASYNYKNLIGVFENEVIEGHEIPYATWRTLGGKLEGVTTADDTTHTVIRTVKRDIVSRVLFFWTFSQKTKTITEYFHNTVYREKADYFLKSEGAFDPEKWGNKENGNTLTLNVDTHPWDISATTGPADNSSSSLFMESPTRIFNVTLNPYSNKILEIQSIMPAEVIRKVGEERISGGNFLSTLKFLTLDATKDKARLLIPEGRRNPVRDATITDKHLPEKMFLISATDLGFKDKNHINSEKSLCSFYTKERILVMKVSKIDVVRSPLSFNNFNVTYKGINYSYTSGVDPEWLKPKLTVDGFHTNYIYTLEPIKVNFSMEELNLYPVKYPNDFLEVTKVENEALRNLLTTGYKFADLKKDVKFLQKAEIAVGIPERGEEEKYRDAKRIGGAYNFKSFGYLAGEEGGTWDVKSLLKNSLKNKEIIVWDNPQDDRPPLVLEELPALLDPLIKGIPFLEKADEMFPEIDLSKFIARLKEIKTSGLQGGLKTLLERLDNDSELEEVCKDLDSYLGNNSNPWLKIGDDPEDTISQKDLNDLVDYVKYALEGDGTPPVRRLKGQELIGSPGSLYYKRYLFLNSRMHRTSGALSRAAKLMLNWEALKDATSDSFNTLEAYVPFIDSILSYESSNLIYSERMYDEENKEWKKGKFIFKEVLENASNNIDDKCLLVCAPCPVADSCRFFDKDELIKTYLEEADGIELWFKDNKLNLIVMEKDEEGKDYLKINKKTSDGTGDSLDVERFKSRQKVYTEIVQNPDSERSLEEIRTSIRDLYPNFYDSDNRKYEDNLGWLTGGRYGTIKIDKESPSKNRYLYDAIFVRDEETEFIYSPSSPNNPYPVKVMFNESLGDHNPVEYDGNVRIYIPNSLRIFEGVSNDSEVYLVSDDWETEEGIPIVPLIYINKLGKVKTGISFDLTDSGDIEGADVARGAKDNLDDPYPADIAQWHINTYKWDSSGNRDQWWMKKIKKEVVNENGVSELITLDGRKRVVDVVDPLVDNTPPMEDVLRGKPFVNSYVNFLRKMHISFDVFDWVKSKDSSGNNKEEARKTLPHMKTNLRLVVIKK